MKARYEYRIRYGRRDWLSDQSRFRQSEAAARRLARGIASSDDTELGGPITFVAIDRRTVGEWEQVEQL
jgi:hypothetical protein